MDPYFVSLHDSVGFLRCNLQISIVRGNLFTYFVVITLFMAACAPEASGPVSSVYHNVTAHYNAYFIANEHIKSIETTLYDQFQWNYNKVLPIYIPIDTTGATTIKAEIEDCIAKASIAIQRHPNSRWVDDSYILVGKARYYALEYADAIETFKYVNKKGDDDNARHEALIELMKTFIDFNQINNAIAVSDYLKKEQLNRRNTRELEKVRAYLYQKRKDLEEMVGYLVQAEALMPKGIEKARISFTIAQAYQQLNDESKAYMYYQNCLKQHPSYELEFYTKLNMAQVTQLTSSSDIKKIRKYFRKLLRDPKNAEYKDKIYYEMGGFELKQGNIQEAIDFYKKSIRSSVQNQRQKAYSYLKLGQVYYDSLKNFELAKRYYDSTVATLPKDEENYEKIKARKEILDEFVKQITIIRTNDSLINVSSLSQDSLVAMATRKVIKQEEQEKEQKRKAEEREKALARANAQNNTAAANNAATTSQSGTSTWYFYNTVTVTKGQSDFQKTWGKRLLEDDWRRSEKTSVANVQIDNDTAAVTQEKAEPTQEELDAARQEEVEKLLAQLPNNQDKIDKMLVEVEEAYYQLGNIYNFKLLEKPNAIQTFETMLTRFPETAHRPEVLYQLYLLYKDKQPELAAERARMLKQEFPESVYAHLIDNPNYREESYALTKELEKVYNHAYRLYQQGNFEQSKLLMDSALVQAPDNSFSDNMALLSILNTGKMEGQYKYQYELNNFLKTYPESELTAYVKSLVEASENYQINLYNSAQAKFIEYFTQKHYLVVAYPNESEISQEIPEEVDAYIKSKNFGLTAGNLILDDKFALVLINEFPGKSTAEKFLQMMETELNLKEKHKGKKIYIFAISQDNFDILYETKDLNAYLNFFEKHYTK